MDAAADGPGWARSGSIESENDLGESDHVLGYGASFFRDPDGIELEVVHAR